MKPLRKICGIPFPLAAVIFLILAYTYFFARPTMLVWQAKRDAAMDPRLALVPVPLSDTSTSTTPGTPVTIFSYEFKVPWQGQVSVKNSSGVAVIFNPSADIAITFFDPQESQGLVKLLRQGLKGRGQDPHSAEVYLGAPSDYDMERSVLFANPGQLSLVFPRRKAVQAATGLMIKDSLELGSETGLYSLNIGQLRGFQFGDPARAKTVRIDAFDAQDREFKFFLSSKSATNPELTQPEINGVLQSLRPAPASEK